MSQLPPDLPIAEDTYGSTESMTTLLTSSSLTRVDQASSTNLGNANLTLLKEDTKETQEEAYDADESVSPTSSPASSRSSCSVCSTDSDIGIFDAIYEGWVPKDWDSDSEGQRKFKRAKRNDYGTVSPAPVWWKPKWLTTLGDKFNGIKDNKDTTVPESTEDNKKNEDNHTSSSKVPNVEVDEDDEAEGYSLEVEAEDEGDLYDYWPKGDPLPWIYNEQTLRWARWKYEGPEEIDEFRVGFPDPKNEEDDYLSEASEGEYEGEGEEDDVSEEEEEHDEEDEEDESDEEHDDEADLKRSALEDQGILEKFYIFLDSIGWGLSEEEKAVLRRKDDEIRQRLVSLTGIILG